ncbi:hypothetical protein GPECTOR_1g655 [Gonium pectorale]|uniref:Uncharacterized protein n=1 Tax=Gonium pectorale TaxID=33097 RepID=A0A150H3I4_GONPE|nr:hypothetical protein GPECTOR_1g655 [Gonium pectorale]|eukprot:KXZ56727.1 hypothetical protein GPECTOR_1g655 [Gonium pectorale]
MAVEPGLSVYATQPGKAAESLAPLLEFAYEHVPKEQWPYTPVRLLATAGLRLLSEEQQADILAACRELLAGSHFVFDPAWATVIGGEMEGLYGWIAVNFLTGALQEAAGHAHHSRKEVLDATRHFTGLLEMGGASMQVTFLPRASAKQPNKHGSHLHLPGVPSRLFTHSYLGLGMDSVLALAAEHVLKRQPRSPAVADPCLPIGYVSEDGRHGNASFAQCLAVVHEILPEHKCAVDTGALAGEASAPLPAQHERRRTSGIGVESYNNDSGAGAPGAGLGGCTLQGSFVPALSGSFVAVENFAWTARALGLPATATLRQLREHGVRYCARHFSSLHAEFSGHIPDQFLVRYCFGAAYILALLHSGLGLGLDDARLTWTNTVREASSGAEVGLNWVLGAAVVDAMHAGGARGGGDSTGSQRFWARDAGGMSSTAIRAALLLPLAAVFFLMAVLVAVLLGSVRGGSKATKLNEKKKRPVGAGLSLEKFATFGVSKFDKRKKLERINKEKLIQYSKYSKLKKKLEAQGVLAGIPVKDSKVAEEKAEKQRAREAAVKEREERLQRVAAVEKARKEQKHLHFKRNAKGQPLMRYRMEKLLSQIQKTS